MAVNGIAKLDRINSLYTQRNVVENFITDDMDDEERREMLMLAYQDSMIAQAVNTPIIDCMSAGREVTDTKLKTATENLSMISVLREAGIMARVTGKCLVLPVLARKSTSSNPDIKLSKIPFSSKLESLGKDYEVLKIIYTTEFEESDEKISDIYSDNFGKPSFYRIGNRKIDPSRGFVINANRSGISFIESIYDYFCDFEIRNHETTKAVKENNFIVLGTDINLLHEIAAANLAASADGARGNMTDVSDEAYSLLSSRIKELRANANSDNGYGIDKEGEDITVLLRTNINQLVGAVSSSMDILCAAADIPSSRYLGKQSGSALSTDNDDLIYIQTLTGLRDFMFGDVIEYLDKLIGLPIGVTNMKFEWNKFSFEPEEELVTDTDNVT